MAAKILIVDDQPLYTEALSSTLRLWQEDIRIWRARTMTECLTVVASTPRLDMVILDLWLPDTQGFGGLVEVRRASPRLPILVCSAFSDADILEKCIVFGAAGVVAKTHGSATIIYAVETILSGKLSFPTSHPQSTNTRSSELSTRLDRLTHKQLRVLQMVCTGKLNKQIAYELAVSEHAIKAHVTEILRKLHVQSRTHAVAEVTKLYPHIVASFHALDTRLGAERW